MRDVKQQLRGDPLPWLLDEDEHNPGVRYFALRDLLGLPAESGEVQAAQEAVMRGGPVPVILGQQDAAGYWIKPGYLPKYRGTMWSIIFLAQLGASGNDSRIRRACEHLFDYAVAEHGGLSMDGRNSGLIHCLQGNLCLALLAFGYLNDGRMQRALDWLARSITGEGIAPSSEKTAPVRYLRSGNSGPGFECSANNHQPCAWGALKALLALSHVPPAQRTPAIEAALQTGVDFFFSCDPATASYPMGYTTKPNGSWFRFGYPIAYVSDVLQILEALTTLGYGADARLENAVSLLLSKQDGEGRWPLEYTYNGKTWVDVEEKGKPSKWVTLRALRVLQRIEASSG